MFPIKSAYDYLEAVLPPFFAAIGIDPRKAAGMAAAHGDKTEQYANDWDVRGIQYDHGVAIYMLTRIEPFAKEVRETNAGFVSPAAWVADNYSKYAPILVALDEVLLMTDRGCRHPGIFRGSVCTCGTYVI